MKRILNRLKFKIKSYLIKLLIFFIRFMIKYGIPTILMILPLLLSVIMCIRNYKDGQFNIQSSIISISLLILFEVIGITLSYKLIQWGKENKMIK